MDIKYQLLKFLKTNTIKQTLITFSGTAINGLLGMIFYILVARQLGPTSFGLLMVTIYTLTLIADVADVGTDTGLIRFIGKYLQTDSKKALKFMKLGLEIKALIWFMIMLLGWLLAPFISELIFLKPELTQPLRLAMVGVGGALFFSFITHSIQAFQKYSVWSILNISMNGLRLLLIIILIYIGSLGFNQVLITYIAITFLGFFIGLLFLPNFFRVSGQFEVSKEFFHYNKWVALSILLAAISSRMDTFILARLLSGNFVGIYTAANQLTVFIPQLVFALAIVVAPKLASFQSNLQAVLYLKKLQFFIISIVFFLLFLIPVMVVLIPLLFGSQFQQSINPFIILFLAQLLFLLALPSHQAIFYYFSKPNVFAALSSIQLITVTLLGILLIPNLGVIGAALAVFTSNLILLILPTLWIIYQFNQKK